MKKIKICKDILSEFRNNLDSKEFLDQFKDSKHFVRKRKLSMFQTIVFLFYSALESMNLSLSNIQDDLKNLHFPDISKQAVSKARQAIAPALFKYFFELTVTKYYSSISSRKTWNDFHIMAIDGTHVELPNTQNIFDAFGLHIDQSSSRQYSYAVGSMLYDVLEDIVIDASIGKGNLSERAAAMDHLLTFEKMELHHNSLVIFDRGYFSETLYRHISNAGYFCLFRIQSQYRMAKNMTSDDEIIDLLVDKPKVKSPIKIRIIRIMLDSGEFEYLATNIMDQNINIEMFKELYFKRWKVESKYFELKEQHYMEEFTGATEVSVKQEFFIKTAITNLCSMVKSDADDQIQKANTNNKIYNANRAYIIGRMKKLIPGILAKTVSLKSIKTLLEKAIKAKTLVRPDRKFKRISKKAHKRKHFKNRKTTT